VQNLIALAQRQQLPHNLVTVMTRTTDGEITRTTANFTAITEQIVARGVGTTTVTGGNVSLTVNGMTPAVSGAVENEADVTSTVDVANVASSSTAENSSAEAESTPTSTIVDGSGQTNTTLDRDTGQTISPVDPSTMTEIDSVTTTVLENGQNISANSLTRTEGDHGHYWTDVDQDGPASTLLNHSGQTEITPVDHTGQLSDCYRNTVADVGQTGSSTLMKGNTIGSTSISGTENVDNEDIYINAVSFYGSV